MMKRIYVTDFDSVKSTKKVISRLYKILNYIDYANLNLS